MPGLNVSRSYFMKKYLLLTLVCAVLGCLSFMYIGYSITGTFPSPGTPAKDYFLAMLITTVLGIIIFQADYILDRLIHWKANFLLRFISGLGANMLIVIFYFAAVSKWLIRVS